MDIEGNWLHGEEEAFGVKISCMVSVQLPKSIFQGVHAWDSRPESMAFSDTVPSEKPTF